MPIEYKSETKLIKLKIELPNGIKEITPIEGKKLTIHRLARKGFILILE